MSALSLEIASVRHRYTGRDRDTPPATSFSLVPGERALLVGQSGTGKTTLLRRVVGLLWGPGKVLVGGEAVEPRSVRRLRRSIGFQWQSPDDGLVLPTPLEDVAFGPVNDGLAHPAAIDLAFCWLERLRIGHLAEAPIRRLSLGEKQLVSLAGVLARSPGILLLDEPAAHLDAATRDRVLEVLSGAEATVFMVTHDPAAWLARDPRWRTVELGASRPEDPH